MALLVCSVPLSCEALFKGDTPKTGPPENEMLRSLTFIRQIGYGFKPENTKALLTMWPCTGDRGAPWEAKLKETEREFWWLGAFLNFPLGLGVAVLFVSQQQSVEL